MTSAGSGVLIAEGEEIPVTYDLLAGGPGRSAPGGQIFGDPDKLRGVFNRGPVRLRLADGRVARVMLTDCEVEGAADVQLLDGPTT